MGIFDISKSCIYNHNKGYCEMRVGEGGVLERGVLWRWGYFASMGRNTVDSSVSQVYLFDTANFFNFSILI